MRLRAGLAVLLILNSLVSVSPAAETLPAEISDAEYWKMISEFSEPGGYFQNVVTSNELSYQYVLPDLIQRNRLGGAYFGVGPEQNFTYMAALQPKIAFIFDIRRDMMLEHLMYKGIFEMSANRVEFVSNLFSRKAPEQLTADSSVQAIFRDFARVPADMKMAEKVLSELLVRLKMRHRFPLAPGDENGIRDIYMTFVGEGVVNFYSSFLSPGYARLMTVTDGAGKNWSYLAANESYERIRAMHQKNLIVPLVGDFAGPKAIRMAAQYLKDHGAAINVFYISNVEDYIGPAWPNYVANIAALPIDSSSAFIRWYIGGSPTLQAITDFVRTQRRSR